MFDDPNTCEPKDGMYKEDHEECQECHKEVKRLCKLYSIKMGLTDAEDHVEKKQIREAKTLEEVKESHKKSQEEEN